MKYTQIRDMDISNGEGIGIALFTQGCPYHCKNCFNPETWSFKDGNLFTDDTIVLILKLGILNQEKIGIRKQKI